MKGIIFWLITILTIILVNIIIEFIANIVTMEMIMPIMYIALGISIFYILRKED